MIYTITKKLLYNHTYNHNQKEPITWKIEISSCNFSCIEQSLNFKQMWIFFYEEIDHKQTDDHFLNYLRQIYCKIDIFQIVIKIITTYKNS